MQIEGSVVHIMKALASHPLAAQCMAEDGTLELLFHIVSNGSLNIFFQLRQGLVPLHTVQLYRHAMQVTFSLLNIHYASHIHLTVSPPHKTGRDFGVAVPSGWNDHSLVL